MVEDVAMLVGTDVSVKQPELTILDNRVRILQVSPSGANRLYFSPAQYDAGLEFFQQKVVVRSGAVLGCIAFSSGDRITSRVLLPAGFHLMKGLLGHDKQLGYQTYRVPEGHAQK